MHRFIAGTCTMHLKIAPKGPWMVRGETKQETFIDQRGRQNLRDYLCPIQDGEGHPVLPASSLKGVLRSTAERILRSMEPDRVPSLRPLADVPFIHNENDLPVLRRCEISDSELDAWNNRHKRYTEDQLAPGHVYTILSPASQLFGCTLHAGLVTLDDAHVPKKKTMRRSHVAIDRFTGGVGEGPFIEELAPADTPLQTRLSIRNFALWHIGLMALVFQEINRGYVHIGGGTRKGQGQVQIDVPCVGFCYAQRVYGASSGIISAQARLKAGDVPPDVLQAEEQMVLLKTAEKQEPRGWRNAGTVSLLVQEEQVQQLFREAVGQAWRQWIRVVI